MDKAECNMLHCPKRVADAIPSMYVSFSCRPGTTRELSRPRRALLRVDLIRRLDASGCLYWRCCAVKGKSALKEKSREVMNAKNAASGEGVVGCRGVPTGPRMGNPTRGGSFPRSDPTVRTPYTSNPVLQGQFEVVLFHICSSGEMGSLQYCCSSSTVALLKYIHYTQ